MARYAPDLCYRSLLSLAEHLSLCATHGGGLHPARGRRLSARPLGHLPPRHLRPPRDVAGQFSHPHVGQPALRHARRLAKQLVGGATDLRRRLAQQSSRASRLRPSRTRLVRIRHHLDHAQVTLSTPSVSSAISKSPRCRRAYQQKKPPLPLHWSHDERPATSASSSPCWASASSPSPCVQHRLDRAELVPWRPACPRRRLFLAPSLPVLCSTRSS